MHKRPNKNERGLAGVRIIGSETRQSCRRTGWYRRAEFGVESNFYPRTHTRAHTHTERAQWAANVLQTSTITVQTFEYSAIAAKLIRWYIRTWLSDTVQLEFSFLRG